MWPPVWPCTSISGNTICEFSAFGADDSVNQCRARGELLAALLREQVLPHKNVGDVRGMGLFWGVELVEDKASKKPFAQTGAADRLAAALLQRGVAVYHGSGCADGWIGDHIMLCPPYTVTEDEVRFLVREVAAAVEEVFPSV